VLDGATIGLLKSVSDSVGPLAVDATRNHLYILAREMIYPIFIWLGVLKVLDGVTNTISTVASLPLYLPNSAPPAINPTTNRLYALTHIPGSTNILVINGASNTVLTSFGGPIGYLFSGLAVNPTTNHIIALGSSITIYDGATNTLLKSISYAPASA